MRAFLRLVLVLGVGFLVLKPYFDYKKEQKKEEKWTAPRKVPWVERKRKSLQYQIVRLRFEIGQLERRGVQNNAREYYAKTEELRVAEHNLGVIDEATGRR
jgi:hypothetical protein